MANNDDDIIFDEGKARELVYFLLNNDAIVYKKFIPVIKGLDSEAFENLFQGIPYKKNANDEDGYNYNVKNKKMFEKLLDKFDNFSVILYEWYKNQQYYPYLKELWTRYISIQNLNGKEEKEQEKLLIANKIDYSNWPEKIKDDFKMLIKNTDNTRIMNLKNIIDDQFSEFNCIIEQLLNFKEKVKEIPDIKQYEINAHNMILKVLGTVMLPIAMCSTQGINAVDAKQIRSVEKLICENTYYDDSKISSLTEKLLEKIKEQTGTKVYKLKDDPIEIIDEVRVKCTDGKIDNLDLCKKAKTFLKSKWVCGLHAVLSFLNLGYSVYELTKTYQGYSQIKNYERRYNEIRTLFNIHKKEIGILPEDFKEAAKRITEVYNKIREDQKALQLLMEDIMKSIKFQESQQKKAAASLVGSVALGTFGIVGGIMTSNGTAVMYGISSIANIISGISNGVNIYMSKDIVKELNALLTKAINLNKEIQDEIDNLIKELTRRMEEEPKFDLNESVASISTNA